VLALVEGQTEQAFVKQILAPDLARQNVFLTACLIGRPGGRGGVRSWARVRSEFLAALKQDRQRCCTTMFDFYGLPADWPGAGEARKKPFGEAAELIERAVHVDICEALGGSFNPDRFIPYIQMHEFEALLFSDTRVLAEVVGEPSLQRHFDEVVAECGEPEAIDDGASTAPSKRIIAKADGYQKVSRGMIAAKRIGLARMKETCPHFAAWVRRLEALSEREPV
jgi:hypothetical protein